MILPFRFPNFKTGNSEVLFYGEGNGYVLIFPNEVPGYGGVDTAFYQLYDDNDLRKVYFFKRIDDSLIKFVGSYTGREKNFSGIAINEILLIRAECNVRLGRINEGLNDLNKLLSYRYKRGTYVEYLTSDANEALDMILQERRKELPFTGQIRWQDLRRLNLDPRLATSIQRRFGSVNLILAPNDPKYVYPFPQIEIDKAGIEQNFR
ncbi:RagB/SusD family nutrient uptake outer membrane protein [uncultured Chitinophaga sp.]|uniref:RagB/SusD family nutrient uptake outer membrane protein n=1 Tax=uncultured Chitinophaga sp. TaxID=339340 RepID=UPI00263354EA|nr:RagB/SusD family nutrient uptake outer membrane protein [uncultured Chitinophaga sp.]